METYIEQELLDLLKSPVQRSTCQNFYEVLGMIWEEDRHSNIIAWLLAPAGPFKNGWLLDNLLKKLDHRVPLGSPTTVHREVQKGTDRPDIIIDWPNFRLVIENKIKSPEGANQCSRYLDTFEITDAARGLLIFLTPSGRWPRSVSVGDSRVFSMSYRVLRGMVEQGIAEGEICDNRMCVLAAEYADALRFITGEGMSQNDEPQIAKATLDVIRLRPQWDAHFQRAAEDTRRFIEWAVHQIRISIQNKSGFPEVIESWTFGYACILRSPEWILRDCEFGLAYSAEKGLGEKLITDLDHRLGVRIQPMSTKSNLQQQSVANEIRKALSVDPVRQKLAKLLGNNVQKQFNQRNHSWWAVDVPFPLRSEESWDNWAQRMKDTVSEMASIVKPVLDAIVNIKEPG